MQPDWGDWSGWEGASCMAPACTSALRHLVHTEGFPAACAFSDEKSASGRRQLLLANLHLVEALVFC